MNVAKNLLNNRKFWAAIAIIALFAFLLKIRNPAGQQFEEEQGSPAQLIDNYSSEQILESFRTEIDSEARPFDAAISLWLAKLSAGVYADEQYAVPKLLYDLRFDSVQSIVSGNDLALVAIKDDLAVVVFRGTNEIKDWYRNFDIRSVSVDHGDVHSGFWNGYQGLRKGILDVLKDHDLTYIWITGHSLGGALALCCAYDLEGSTSLEITGLVTFGQPKLGDSTFAARIDESLRGRYIVVVNEEDPVADTVPNCHFCGSGVWLRGSKILRTPHIPLSGNYGATDEGDHVENDEFVPTIMTREELEEERSRLDDSLEPQVGPNGEPLYSGNIPFFHDHAIDEYVRKLESHFSSDN